MSQVLLVTYDLKEPGSNYEVLLRLIKNHSGWARLGGSSYLIFTDDTPVEVRDRLVAALDQNDQLFVGVAPSPSAWFGLPDDVSNWILANQK